MDYNCSSRESKLAMTSQANNIKTLAESILDLEILIAPAQEKIEALKQQLRAECALRQNVGFKEEILGKGSVEVKAAALPKLKGTEPTLNLEYWTSLPLFEQARYQAIGIVDLERVYSQARKAAVSVKLAPKAALLVATSPTFLGARGAFHH